MVIVIVYYTETGLDSRRDKGNSVHEPCIIHPLIMFNAKPIPPRIMTDMGSLTCSTLTKRSMDWRKMERASAIKNIPLKNAPVVIR